MEKNWSKKVPPGTRGGARMVKMAIRGGPFLTKFVFHHLPLQIPHIFAKEIASKSPTVPVLGRFLAIFSDLGSYFDPQAVILPIFEKFFFSITIKTKFPTFLQKTANRYLLRLNSSSNPYKQTDKQTNKQTDTVILLIGRD